MTTITKKHITHKIARKIGFHPAEVRIVIQSFLDAISDQLASGDRIEFRDFGIFEVVVRKQKIGRNPRRPKIAVIIPERKGVKFTPEKKLRRLVRKEQQLKIIDHHFEREGKNR